MKGKGRRGDGGTSDKMKRAARIQNTWNEKEMTVLNTVMTS